MLVMVWAVVGLVVVALDSVCTTMAAVAVVMVIVHNYGAWQKVMALSEHPAGSSRGCIAASFGFSFTREANV